MFQQSWTIRCEVKGGFRVRGESNAGVMYEAKYWNWLDYATTWSSRRRGTWERGGSGLLLHVFPLTRSPNTLLCDSLDLVYRRPQTTDCKAEAVYSWMDVKGGVNMVHPTVQRRAGYEQVPRLCPTASPCASKQHLDRSWCQLPPPWRHR